MKIFVPFAKIDAEQRMVWGYASTEARDDQGEIVKRDALSAALPEYMKFGNIREMHQLSAVGTAKEAAVDDKGLYLGSKIVDPLAWEKVKEGVYKGYSIGGRVTQRDPADYKTITGLTLNEISLVDRPANPEAILDVWKAGTPMPFNPPLQIWSCGIQDHRHIAKVDALRCQEKQAAAVLAGDPNTLVKSGDLAVFIDAGAAAPAQIVADQIAAAVQPTVEEQVAAALAQERASNAALAVLERAAAAPDTAKGGDAPGEGDKPYGDVKYADPGYQADGKKRYPIDTEKHIRAAWNYINKPKNSGKYSSDHLASIKSRIVAAWKDKIDSDGPPSAENKKTSQPVIAKSLWDIGNVAMIVADLMNLSERLAIEALMEGDDSGMAARAAAACETLCQFLRDLVAEETAEVLEGTEIDHPVMLSAKAIDNLSAALRKSIPDTQRAEALVESIQKVGARHNATDKAQLDTAAYAVHRAMGLSTAKRAEQVAMVDCHKAVLDAGATNVGAEGREVLSDGSPMQGAGSATQHSTVDTGHNPSGPAPNPTGAVPSSPHPGPAQMGKASDPIAFIDAMVKAGKGHVALCSCAHDLLCAVSDGATCKEGAAKPTRHSADDMAMMHKAHAHLMMVDGVQCAAASEPIITAAAPTGDLSKAASDGLAKAVDTHVAPLREALGTLLTTMTKMSERVEQIAQTPLPPSVIARVAPQPAGTTIAKGSALDDALAKAGDDELTQALIKRSHRNPMAIPGITDGQPARQPRT
jgi:phage head maturation protease